MSVLCESAWCPYCGANGTHSKDVTKILSGTNKSGLIRRLGIVLKAIFCWPERRERKGWVEEEVEVCTYVQGRMKEKTMKDDGRGGSGHRPGRG